MNAILRFLTVCMFCMGLAQGQQKKPNILFIFSDDHAYQAIGAYGNKLVQTPHIDRIAKEGAVFEQFMVTKSICGPSRANLLTGKYSHKNGFMDNEGNFNINQQVLSRLLQQADYETAWIGKWHLGTLPGDAFNYWHILPNQGYYYNPDFINAQHDTSRYEGYVTDIITQLSTAWLDERPKDKPFFLVIGEKATHREWLPAIEDLGAYDAVNFPLPATFYDDYQGRKAAGDQDMTIEKSMRLADDLKVHAKFGLTEAIMQERLTTIRNRGGQQRTLSVEEEQQLRKEINEGMYARLNPEQAASVQRYYDKITAEFEALKPEAKALTEWKYQRYMKDYLATANSLDRNIGKILDYLDKHGLAENTIVIYGSDQGFYLGEHGWFDKRFIYQESLRTPFLIRYPGVVKPGTRIGQQLLNIDWAPTLLEIAGLSVPSDIQGQSFLSLLHKPQQTKPFRKASYYHYYEFPHPHHVSPHFGITTERFKLVRFYKGQEAWELYDLKKDPLELHNQIANKKYAKQIIQLKQWLAEACEQYDDQLAAGILKQQL
ncbi:sulfatase family protein [Sphingobacterium humi]|uniref:Sulfatase-like hydrolase/transferase n=1 Tax=Sphingobacterium humi TaxID=1796905 RepID=A0A6N8KUE8_9SPHI|nr:sulfatase [Sphingobacterium humi]MVZ60717.1 sulfatase-like hydrolase/transferase [Sphingobacterium humi]